MFEKLGLTRMAQNLASHSAMRIGVVANNVANADTPGYRARDVREFGKVYAGGTPLSLRSSRAGHMVEGRLFGSAQDQQTALAAGGGMSPNGNDVSLDQQMMKMAKARQSHDMALAVYRATSSITRTALGRSG